MHELFPALINLNFLYDSYIFLLYGVQAHSNFYIFAQFFGSEIEHLQMYTCMYRSLLCLNTAVFLLPLGQGQVL